MAVTVGEVCAEINNWFVDTSDIYCENFTISGGSISPSNFLQDNQYFRIEHSVFNDGVYQNNQKSLESLTDETFLGYIWAMKVPPDFLKICSLISAWDDKYGGVNTANFAPYQSESYAGQYSYSKASAGVKSNTSGNAVTWQQQFASMLNKYRKVCGAR